MKPLIGIALFALAASAATICAQNEVAPSSQNAPVASVSSAPSVAEAQGCCGPITKGGEKLIALLDSMDVEHHWTAGIKVDWKSGLPVGGGDERGHTHCSAFAAAVGERIGVYMLRPPEHRQSFLASAQGRWFASSAGREDGWQQIYTLEEAQQRANQGYLVVLDFISPNPKKPGHIAIVRPAIKSEAALREEGPETTQAGAHNFTDGNARFSFGKHEGAWPTHVLAFWHETKFSRLKDNAEAR